MRPHYRSTPPLKSILLRMILINCIEGRPTLCLTEVNSIIDAYKHHKYHDALKHHIINDAY